MTTASSQLDQQRQRYADLQPQIADLTDKISALSVQIGAHRQKYVAKGQDPPFPSKLVDAHNQLAHQRAALVRESEVARIAQGTIAKEARRVAAELETVEAQLAGWVEVLDDLEPAKQALSRVENALIRNGVVISPHRSQALRVTMEFLESPTALLARAAYLRARRDELGTPEEL
jgi:hypothetical protein